MCGVVSNGLHERVYDEQGRSPCLWDGCARGAANPLMASSMHLGKWLIGNALSCVKQHEAMHIQGAPSRG